jgi:hypothetical protein
VTARIPITIDVVPQPLEDGFLFWMDEIGDTWEDAAEELLEAFVGSQHAAQRETSIVYVVRNDDLLGRSGPTRAMVAAGLVSGARTAAIEGSRKGWTANVVAYDPSIIPQLVLERALLLLDDDLITGELVHLGPGHIGKALV